MLGGVDGDGYDVPVLARRGDHLDLDVIAEPESFLVTKQDRLEPREQDRARDWGARLAASIAAGIVPG